MWNMDYLITSSYWKKANNVKKIGFRGKYVNQLMMTQNEWKRIFNKEWKEEMDLAIVVSWDRISMDLVLFSEASCAITVLYIIYLIYFLIRIRHFIFYLLTNFNFNVIYVFLYIFRSKICIWTLKWSRFFWTNN